MRRALVCAGVAWLALITPAHAQPPPGSKGAFRPCGRNPALRCGKVTVPLDRSGARSGTVALNVKRMRGVGPVRGAVFALAGGPGQAATPFTEDFATVLRRALRGRELVTFDQRGTGHSGVLRCPTLEAIGERLVDVAGAASDCAETLGPTRSLYTTRESVQDLEAVRQAVGAERITLYGVSYGTKLALAYAATYPARVERLVLDSVVGLDGPDPFGRDSLQAITRVLRLLCAKGCEKFTSDPNSDLAALVSRLGGGLLRGPLVRSDGRPHPSRLGRVRILEILLAGDFDPWLRAAFPAAVRSAVNGDPAPILRLGYRATRILTEPVSHFNPALFAATVCEEGPLPWSRTAPTQSRLAQARALFESTPDSQLGPFDRLTAFVTSGAVQVCRLWPSAIAEPALPSGPFPAVPTLVLAGEDDVRTPLETATAVAAKLPGATVLAVPDAGHSVLDWPTAGCARRAVRKFLTGKPVSPCPRKRRLVPVEPMAPTSLEQVAPVPGMSGKVGRTLAAVERTLRDMTLQLIGAILSFDIFRPAIGGLRGGRAKFKLFGLELERVEYVPGVKVSGHLRGAALTRGVVRISGPSAAAGRLRLRRGVLSGRLGGRRVRLVLAPATLGGEGAFSPLEQFGLGAAPYPSGLSLLPARRR
jgi:pimeloyl-ACP methyl ester carboxylesterase